MIERRRIVLAIFAHPDDDELSCFGTLARLHQEGADVYVLELTSGEHSLSVNSSMRLGESDAAGHLIGCSVLKERLSDGYVKYDFETIAIIEKHIQTLTPQIVITHYPQELGQGHQDHLAVASAVVNTARRNDCVEWILYAEPPTQNWGFQPNFFVDVTEYIKLKMQAVSLHQSEMGKPYLQSEIVETRAKWWALQAHPTDFRKNRLYEAFVIVKGMLGQNTSGNVGL